MSTAEIPALYVATDLILAKHTCSAINKLARCGGGLRLPNGHHFFRQVATILTSNLNNLDTSQWIPLCEQGVTVLYELAEQPNSVAETLLRELSQLASFEGKPNTPRYKH